MTGMRSWKLGMAVWLATAFLLASCSAGRGNSMPPGVGTPTPALPFYVYAQCTLMGGSGRTEIPRGRPLVVLWGWTAAGEDQMQDFIRLAAVTVTLDGKGISGMMKGDIRYDKEGGVYRAVWAAEAGVPEIGSHVLTYRVTFAAPVTDGVETFGPGSERETLADRCSIEVR